MAAKRGDKNSNQKKGINFWQMMRDVLIASLSKGQFPIAMLGFIIIIVILKMPSEDVSQMAFELLENVRKFDTVGFIISILMLFGWFIHIKLQRRSYSKEIERISEERNFYQTQLLGKNVNSSRRS